MKLGHWVVKVLSDDCGTDGMWEDSRVAVRHLRRVTEEMARVMYVMLCEDQVEVRMF